MKFEVCANIAVNPITIEADSLEEACEITNGLGYKDFEFWALEITDVYEVDGE